MRMILFALMCIPVAFSARAEDVWTWYQSMNHIVDIACEGDFVWCATSGGVIRHNRQDGSLARYTRGNGLADNRVTDLFIDRDGRKWFATGRGLSCYDNMHWITYTDEDCPGCNRVIGMVQDHEGVMWFGTREDGVLSFNGTVWKAHATPDGIPESGIGAALAVDSDNVKWFAAGEKLVSFDGDVWRTFTHEDGLPSGKTISDIAVDRSGIIWMAAESELVSFDGSRFTRYQPEFLRITSLTIDESGILWLGAPTGLARFDGAGFTEIPAEVLTFSPYAFRNLAIDPDGGIWCTTGFSYSTITDLACWDGSTWKWYMVDDHLVSNEVQAAGVDGENRKWFGTLLRGISRFDGSQWEQIPVNEPYGDEFTAIAFDHEGTAWLGMKNTGVMCIDGNARKTYPLTDKFPGRVNAIAVGRDNAKWFASMGGIVRFDGMEWKTYTREDGVANDYDVTEIVVDRDDTVWAGSSIPGLSFFDGASWESVSPREGLPNVSVRSITVDDENVKWFCVDGGVSRFDGVSWQFYSGDDYFGGNEVLAAAADRNNVKWFATRGGITRFDGTAWKTYLPEAGLPLEGVEIILVDLDNVKWFINYRQGIISLDDRTATPVWSEIPLPLALSNHPNPFNPSTTISFSLPAPGRADLTVYDITGRKVRDLVTGHLPAGAHSVVWDGRDDTGRAAATGVYFSRLRFPGRTTTGKMLLVR